MYYGKPVLIVRSTTTGGGSIVYPEKFAAAMADVYRSDSEKDARLPRHNMGMASDAKTTMPLDHASRQ